MRYLLPKVTLLSAATLVLSCGVTFAQSTPGSEGASDAGAGAATPSVQLGPMQPPVVKPLADAGASGDIDAANAAPMAGAMSTIVLHADGSRTTVPASAALAALLGQPAPASGAATRSGPAPAAAVPKITAVKRADVYPYRATGLIEAIYGQQAYDCSGELIGPQTVLTSAFCLYGANGQAAYPDKISFYSGVNGRASGGPYEADTAAIMQEFTEQPPVTDWWGLAPYAIGVVILKDPIGNKLGWIGFQTDVNHDSQPTALVFDQNFNLGLTVCNEPEALMYRSFAQSVPCASPGYGQPLLIQDPQTKGVYITGLNVLPLDTGDPKTPGTWIARISAITYQWLTDNRK